MAGAVDPTTGLTPQQEAFAQAVATGISLSDAYRQAYNVAPTTPGTTTWPDASALAKHPKVFPRIQALKQAAQATVAAEHAWTLGKMVTQAEKHMDVALQDHPRRGPNVSAANGALEIIGKVTGLLRADTVAIQVSPASASGLDGLTTEELRLLISQRQEALELMRQMRDAASPRTQTSLPQPEEGESRVLDAGEVTPGVENGSAAPEIEA